MQDSRDVIHDMALHSPTKTSLYHVVTLIIKFWGYCSCPSHTQNTTYIPGVYFKIMPVYVFAKGIRLTDYHA